MIETFYLSSCLLSITLINSVTANTIFRPISRPQGLYEHATFSDPRFGLSAMNDLPSVILKVQ